MRKLLINNFFALAIAALICTAVRTVVWVNDLVNCSDLFVTGLLGIAAASLFKRGRELIDKRFNGLYIANEIMYVASLIGMAATLYAGYSSKRFWIIAGFIFVLISKIARIFIYIYSAKIMIGLVSSKEQSGNKKGWTIQLVISIVCWSVNLFATVFSHLFVYRTQEIARRFEIAAGLVSLGVYMAMLIYLIFLLDKTSKSVVEKIVEEDTHLLGNTDPHLKYKSDEFDTAKHGIKNNEETVEPRIYGYKSRAITVTVSVVLVFLLLTIVRYGLISSAVSKVEKLVSKKVTTQAEPGESTLLSKLGFMPADDWKTVSSLEEIKELQNSEEMQLFVIETDKSNIEPISGNEFKATLGAYDANTLEFMYGKGSLFRNRVWTITDYKITFEDGSYVYATYATRAIDKLEDGVVKLPIAYSYKTEVLEKVMDIELENRHVFPTELRKPWMKETPVCGSFDDKLEFAQIIYRNAGIYVALYFLLTFAAIIVSVRFLFKDITD